MTRLVALALALAPLGPAAAQNLTPLHAPGNLTGEVVALCETGKGCACSSTNAADDLLMVHGLAATVPDGFAGDQRAQTIVIDLGSGQVYRSTAPRARINAAYGGADPCEPEAPPEIQPNDGLWRWCSMGETVSGCPPMLAAALAGGPDEAREARVAWQGAFDPRRLAEGLPRPEMVQMSPYEWRKLGPGHWLSDNLRQRSCEDGTCVSVDLALSMTLAAPDRITGLLTLTSRVEGPQAGILAGLGMADCRVRQRYRIERVAP